MWKVDPEKPGIRIEGPLLTFECREGCKFRARHIHGARYSQRLSREFPYFEVSFNGTKTLDFSLLRDKMSKPVTWLIFSWRF